jgi:Mn-dependent DtxR family transcriptional regulator
MSPTEYEYLFILDALERKEPIFPFIVQALKESGLVDVSEQGISLTPAGESLMQQVAEKDQRPRALSARCLSNDAQRHRRSTARYR